MKAILEFNLPGEESEHKLALDGGKWMSVCHELDQWLRSETGPRTPLIAQKRLYPIPEKLKSIRGHDNRKVSERFDARMHEIARVPCDERQYFRQVSRAKNRSIALG
jgi:hypothetical protein